MKMLYYISLCVISFSCQASSTAPDTSEMALIEGGTFSFGQNGENEERSPAVQVKIRSFYLDEHEVTNEDFNVFVHSTNYVTQAEKAGGSYTYQKGWKFQEGLYWNTEYYGENEQPTNWQDLPAVHISFEDAKSYCNWKNKRLPTEQELEYAMKTNNSQQFNIWEGTFPDRNTQKDGYLYTAPIKSYAAGENGVFDLKGNVWEWTADNYHYNVHNILAVADQRLAYAWQKASYDPSQPKPEVNQKVIKGGSFLCHDSYCCGYEASARMAAEPKMSYFHLGFRCACDL